MKEGHQPEDSNRQFKQNGSTEHNTEMSDSNLMNRTFQPEKYDFCSHNLDAGPPIALVCKSQIFYIGNTK